jgi:hypothetical protein
VSSSGLVFNARLLSAHLGELKCRAGRTSHHQNLAILCRDFDIFVCIPLADSRIKLQVSATNHQAPAEGLKTSSARPLRAAEDKLQEASFRGSDIVSAPLNMAVFVRPYKWLSPALWKFL